jgi:putative ABC transport system substrate-binding protein
MNRRREFITLLGGAAAWPLAARAQQPERMRRIGVLGVACKQLGWSNGRNIVIDIRWAGGSSQRSCSRLPTR